LPRGWLCGTFKVDFSAESVDGFAFHVNATGAWWRYGLRQRHPESAAESYVIDKVSSMASNCSVLAAVALERKVNAYLGRGASVAGLGTRVRWARAHIDVDPETQHEAHTRMRLRARAKAELEDRRLRIAQAVELRDLLREDSTLALAHLLLVAPEKIENLASGGIIKTVGEQIAAYAPGATWVKTAQMLEKSFGEMPDDAKQAIVDRIYMVLSEFGKKREAEHLQETYRWQ
jgi:hypothetical protein